MILFYAFWLLVNLLKYYFLIITKFVHFPKVVNFLKRWGIAPLPFRILELATAT